MVTLARPRQGELAALSRHWRWYAAVGAGSMFLGFVASPITQRFEQWGWTVASGSVSALLGLLVLSQWPVTDVWFLALFIGVELLVVGAAWLGAAVLAHRAGPAEGAPPVPA